MHGCAIITPTTKCVVTKNDANRIILDARANVYQTYTVVGIHLSCCCSYDS